MFQRHLCVVVVLAWAAARGSGEAQDTAGAAERVPAWHPHHHGRIPHGADSGPRLGTTSPDSVPEPAQAAAAPAQALLWTDSEWYRAVYHHQAHHTWFNEDTNQLDVADLLRQPGYAQFRIDKWAVEELEGAGACRGGWDEGLRVQRDSTVCGRIRSTQAHGSHGAGPPAHGAGPPAHGAGPPAHGAGPPGEGACLDLCLPMAAPRCTAQDPQALDFGYGNDVRGACLEYLPAEYPPEAPPKQASVWDIGRLHAHLDASQRRSPHRSGAPPQPEGGGEACAGAQVMVGRNEPYAGVAVKLVWASYALVLAALQNVTFTPGLDYLQEWTSLAACGPTPAGRRNLYCFFQPWTPCLQAAGARHVGLPEPFDEVALPQFQRYGSFWTHAHALHWWWRLAPPVAARVAGMRERAGVRLGDRALGPLVGVHVRRGDSCTNGRYCPALNATFLPVLQRLRAQYGARRVFLSTDDAAALAECRAWEGFDCRALEVNRSIYAPPEGFAQIEERVRWADPAMGDPGMAALELVADIDTLGHCDIFVGMFSSMVGRLAYQLMFARKRRHVPFVSLQWPWAKQDGRIN